MPRHSATPADQSGSGSDFGSALEQSYTNYFSYPSCRTTPSRSRQGRVDYQLIVGCLECIVGAPLDQSQLGKYADIAMNILVVASELSRQRADAQSRLRRKRVEQRQPFGCERAEQFGERGEFQARRCLREPLAARGTTPSARELRKRLPPATDADFDSFRSNLHPASRSTSAAKSSINNFVPSDRRA